MAILIFCGTCNRYASLQHARCPRCGGSLDRNGQYRVNLPNFNGERITQVVHGSLQDAFRVEEQIRHGRNMVRDAVALGGLNPSSLSQQFIEHLFAFLLSRNSPLSFILFDSDGDILQLSDGACALMADTRESLVQKRIQELCTPMAKLIERKMLPDKNGLELKLTLPFRGVRGETELNTSLLRVSARGKGCFALLLMVSKAYTHHDLVSVMEEIFNYAPVGIYQITPAGKIQYANRQMAKLFGYGSPESFMAAIQSTRQLYLHPEQRQEIVELLNKADVERDVEFQLIRQDGSPFWARFTSRVVRDNAGNVTYYEGFISDISARKKAQDELRASLAAQEKYRRELEAVFGAITDGIVSIDKETRVAASNRSFERICPQSDLIKPGITLNDLPKKCLSGCFLSVRKVLDSQTFLSPYQVECPHVPERRLSLEVVTSVLNDSDGANCGSVMTLRDISKLRALEEQLTIRKNYKWIVGESAELRKVYFIIDRLKGTDSAVLITGESGTGKELAAEALHYSSRRKDKPFVKINCAALSDTLLESDLFGHVKGAFTGADSAKVGRLQMAEGGTALLDEIGDISHDIQLKLLRFLDYKEYQRVGDPMPHSADVRIIASTNADLVKKVKEGSFRLDLYHRLKVITVNMPPLREIRQDIPMLTQHLLGLINKQLEKNIRQISKPALERLMDYDWPGNVRELKHVLEYACVVCEEETINMRHLPTDLFA